MSISILCCYRADTTHEQVTNIGLWEQVRKRICGGLWFTAFCYSGSAVVGWERSKVFWGLSTTLHGLLGRTTAFQSGIVSQGILDISLSYIHGDEERKLLLKSLLQHEVTETLWDYWVLMGWRAIHLQISAESLCLWDQLGSSTGDSTFLVSGMQ